MQKYFKILHSHYCKTHPELQPLDKDLNIAFNEDELKTIGYSEYEIKLTRKC